METGTQGLDLLLLGQLQTSAPLLAFPSSLVPTTLPFPLHPRLPSRLHPPPHHQSLKCFHRSWQLQKRLQARLQRMSTPNHQHTQMRHLTMWHLSTQMLTLKLTPMLTLKLTQMPTLKLTQMPTLKLTLRLTRMLTLKLTRMSTPKRTPTSTPLNLLKQSCLKIQFLLRVLLQELRSQKSQSQSQSRRIWLPSMTLLVRLLPVPTSTTRSRTPKALTWRTAMKTWTTEWMAWTDRTDRTEWMDWTEWTEWIAWIAWKA
jgi:hypothetical protein